MIFGHFVAVCDHILNMICNMKLLKRFYTKSEVRGYPPACMFEEFADKPDVFYMISSEIMHTLNKRKQLRTISLKGWKNYDAIEFVPSVEEKDSALPTFQALRAEYLTKRIESGKLVLTTTETEEPLPRKRKRIKKIVRENQILF